MQLRSLHQFVSRWPTRVFGLGGSRRLSLKTTSLLWGGLGGLYLIAWSHQWMGHFGLSLPAVTAAGLAWATGLTLGLKAGGERIASRASRTLGASGTLSRSPAPALRPPPSALRSPLTHLALAAWTVALPWLLQTALSSAGLFPLETLASPVRLLFFSGFWAMLILAPPAYWLTRLPILLVDTREGHRTTASQKRERESAALALRSPLSVLCSSDPSSLIPHPSSLCLCGLAAGIVLNVFLLAPWSGVNLGGLLAALMSGIIFLVGITRSVSGRGENSGERRAESGEPEKQSPGISGSAYPEPAISTRLFGSLASHLSSLILFAGFGAVIALTSRAAGQFMPTAGFVMCIQWAAILCGAAWGVSRSVRQRRSLPPDPSTDDPAKPSGPTLFGPVLLVAVWAVVVPASFGRLVDLSLILNAHVSQVWLLMTLRSLLIAGLFMPIGFGLGHCLLTARPTRLWPVAAAGGLFLIRWAALPHAETADLFVVTSWLLACLAVVHWWGESFVRGRETRAQPRRSLPRRWTTRVVVAASLGLIVLGPWFERNYDPTRSAKLLFGTDVTLAKSRGCLSQCLPFLDEGRPFAVREADWGTYTVWKYRGVQLRLRDNGVPKGVVTTDAAICPHYCAETLPAVVPLVLHEHPQRVLLLGLGSGVPLTTCLSFPVQELTCLEGDAGLIDLLQSVVWPHCGVDPLAAGYVRLWNVDPVVGLAALNQHRAESGERRAKGIVEGPGSSVERQRGPWPLAPGPWTIFCSPLRYDVIVCSPDHPALMQSSPEFTLEFYRRAACRLEADGIFCQRFQQIDFGPEPLRVVARTMQAAFRNVAAVETAPGEVLLLGTNAADGFNRDGFSKRLQAPHVRRVLAQCGWDWSVPLNLAVSDPERLAGFTHQREVRINTACTSRLAYRLPQEVMRWGPKQNEVRTALAEFSGRCLNWINADQPDPGLLRRLSEVNMQRDVQLDYPDEFWAYRKTVRDHLTGEPRPVIQQVSMELEGRKLHPVDERRLDYFRALGQAAQSPHPTPEAVQNVADFADPYDPLITPFLHHEVARLYSRSAPRNVQAELGHRLHAVYFAEAGDRSIRNVATALTLLIAHPEAVPEPADRADHINALLQVLKSRWDNRAAVKPTSTRVALNDIDLSVSALEQSFDAMQQLQRELGWPARDWTYRRLWLERTLLRPLETYRSRLLPHHLKQRRAER